MPAVILDRDIRARWVNDAAAAMLGYTIAELMNLDAGRIIHSDSRAERELAEVWLRVGAVDALTTTCRLVCQDGSSVWAKIHTSVLADEEHLVLLLIEDRTDQYWSSPGDFGTPTGTMCP